MKILVIGSGGREHALCWRLRADGHEIYALPGSAGIAEVAGCLPGAADDQERVVAAACEVGAELVVIGPEQPLVAGLADTMRAAGFAVFGPSAAAAQLEGSKAFSKHFFARHGIRTAAFFECSTMQEAERAIDSLGDRVVVKADGLAAGKGVVVCASSEEARAAAREMLEGGRFAEAGARIVIEARLEGREVSMMALCDGKRYELLAPAEDHKAIFDGDKGPNTGGMGTVSPPAWVSDALVERARREIFDPTLAGLSADGLDFRGVLYAGLMVDAEGTPYLLEYNVRFGDPETQPVMARLRGDFGQCLLGAAQGHMPEGAGDAWCETPGHSAEGAKHQRLPQQALGGSVSNSLGTSLLTWDPRTAVCVVLASRGYPESASTGDVITGLEEVRAMPDITVFQAGCQVEGERVVTSGGRVLAVTGLGLDLQDARHKTYAAVERIQFSGKQFRRDIGQRGAQDGEKS